MPYANFAPVEALVKAKDTETPSSDYLLDAIRAKYQEKMAENKNVWREILGVGQMIAYFIEGKQQLFYNPFTRAYAPVALKTNARKPRAMNVMQFYATKHEQQWLGSNPNVRVVAQGDDEKVVGAAKAADIILDHYERKFYTIPFSQAEIKLVECFGTNINRVRFDPGLAGNKVLREIIEEREIQIGDGFGECECGHAGAASEFNEVEVSQGVSMPMCGECGSFAVMVEQPPVQMQPMVVGSQEMPYGDLLIECVPFPSCRWDIETSIEKSSWAIIEKLTNLGAVQLALGKIKLKERETDNPGIQVMESITGLGATWDASGMANMLSVKDGRSQHRVISTEFFLSPEDMWDIRAKKDEKTVSGQTIPKDARLSDLFPNGACICGLNGLDVVTGIYPDESHKNQLTSGAYFAKPLSGLGRGLVDMVESQKRLNLADSQIFDYNQSLATPAVLHAKGAIKQDEMQYLGHPKANIPVDLQHFPNVNSLDALVRPLQPSSAGAQFYDYAYNTLTNFMQMQSHVMNFSEALPALKGKTAYAANLGESLAQSLFGPLLAGKIQIRTGNAKNLVYNYKEHFPFPKYFSANYKGKNRQLKGKYLKGADCEGDFEYYVEQDSELPRSLLTKRQETHELFNNVFGGFQNYIAAMQTNPDEVQAVMRQYNFDLEIDTSDNISEICRERLDDALMLADQQMQQLQASFGQQGSAYFQPDAVLMGMRNPIEKFEMEHEAQLKWYADYFHTDDGMAAAPHHRAVVNTLIGTHFLYAQQQQQLLAQAAGEVQMAANAPAMEQEMANQEQQLEFAGRQQQMEGEKAQADLENQADAELIKTGGQMARDRDKLAIDKQRQQMKNAQRT